MTTFDQVVLGRALRDLRARAGLTQADLATRAKTSNTYVSRLEIGQRDIRWTTVMRLLDALGADLYQLADAIAEVEKQDRAAKQ
jgi:XRE family transcriptional regulator, fatty acid utilization regulator